MKLRHSVVALLVVFSATLGFSFASWRAAWMADEKTELLIYMQAEMQCLGYWRSRSGIADARYQFGKGR